MRNDRALAERHRPRYPEDEDEMLRKLLLSAAQDTHYAPSSLLLV